MSREILKVENLSMRFGGLLAVNGVALTVKEKQVVALIGPNGAGKTTVFNCLTGFYKPSGGNILLDVSRSRAWPVTKSPARVWCEPSRTCVCSRT